MSSIIAILSSLGVGTASLSVAVLAPRVKKSVAGGVPRRVQLVVAEPDTEHGVTPQASPLSVELPSPPEPVDAKNTESRAAASDVQTVEERSAPALFEEPQAAEEPQFISPGEMEEDEAPAKPRGGLFRGLRSILSIGKRKDAAEPEAVHDVLDVEPVHAVIHTSIDAVRLDDLRAETAHKDTDRLDLSSLGEPPSLSLDKNGTIQEYAGEAAPSISTFKSSAASMAEQIETERAEEERRAAAAREAQEAAERMERELAEEAHKRELEKISAESEARAKGEAWTRLWFVRLDPDADAPKEQTRMKMATSLGVPAPWAAKLISLALEQEESERVRARLIGALARGGHRKNAKPFQDAAARSQAEAVACAEALRPFVREAAWIEQLVEQQRT